jgi:molybdopterin-guanine dinucleotide biosynthesis protein A
MTGIILSGGRNRRMGENKAFLRYRGERLIDRTVRLFRALFSEVIIVTVAPLDYLSQEATVVTDLLADKGALGGIYTGLFYARTEKAFVAACDMPFLNEAFLTHLIGLAEGYDIVVPQVPEGFQPLHAIYDRRCLPAIRAHLDRAGMKVTGFYPGHRLLAVPVETCRRFDPELRLFLNVNTPADRAALASPAGAVVPPEVGAALPRPS